MSENLFTQDRVPSGFHPPLSFGGRPLQLSGLRHETAGLPTSTEATSMPCLNICSAAYIEQLPTKVIFSSKPKLKAMKNTQFKKLRSYIFLALSQIKNT